MFNDELCKILFGELNVLLGQNKVTENTSAVQMVGAPYCLLVLSLRNRAGAIETSTTSEMGNELEG